MAGLSVLLETKSNSHPRKPQILSQATLLSPKNSTSPTPTPPPAPAPTRSPFLQCCFLCRRELAEGNDIYMYRGDRAFCSEECRCRQIFMDEVGSGGAAMAAARRRRVRAAAAASLRAK